MIHGRALSVTRPVLGAVALAKMHARHASQACVKRTQMLPWEHVYAQLAGSMKDPTPMNLVANVM